MIVAAVALALIMTLVIEPAKRANAMGSVRELDGLVETPRSRALLGSRALVLRWLPRR